MFLISWVLRKTPALLRRRLKKCEVRVPEWSGSKCAICWSKKWKLSTPLPYIWSLTLLKIWLGLFFQSMQLQKTKAININITSSNYNWECSKSRCRSSKNSSKTILILATKNLTSKLNLKCWLSSVRNWLIDLEIVCNLIVYLKSSKKWKSLLMSRFRRKRADWRKSIWTCVSR